MIIYFFYQKPSTILIKSISSPILLLSAIVISSIVHDATKSELAAAGESLLLTVYGCGSQSLADHRYNQYVYMTTHANVRIQEINKII